MKDRTCESCRNRHDCKAKEAYTQLQRLGGGQCSGYEHEEQTLNGDFEAFARKVREQVSSVLNIPLAVLEGIEGEAVKARKERFIELLKAADEYSADRAITDYDEAIADNAEYLIAHGATVCEWIPVTGRLPENNAEVLAYNGEIRVYTYENKDKWWTDEGWSTTEKYGLTHWMPLPEPPKKEGAEP